jgi:hypothetical protein
MKCRKAVGNRETGNGKGESPMPGFLKEVRPDQSAIHLRQGFGERVGNRQSAIGNRQSAIGNRQSAIGNRQSAIGNRQSAIGNRQSAMNFRRRKLDY